MHMMMTMIRKALATPGTALAREDMILASEGTRLKRRKTRNARNGRSSPSEGGKISMSAASSMSEIVPRKTMSESKMFQPPLKKFLYLEGESEDGWAGGVKGWGG